MMMGGGPMVGDDGVCGLEDEKKNFEDFLLKKVRDERKILKNKRGVNYFYLYHKFCKIYTNTNFTTYIYGLTHFKFW